MGDIFTCETPVPLEFIILIAPNVSDQMGGEAIKALQTCLELQKRNLPYHQITHQRVRHIMAEKFPQIPVSFVEESKLQAWLWKSQIFRPMVKLIFQWHAAKMASELLKQHPGAVVHYTSPVSPVLPAFRIKNARVVMGPINGNIYYPPGFYHRESWTDWFRRVSHPTLQRLHRIFFRGKQSADVLLISGNAERTRKSLLIAGCRESQFEPTIDSGIENRLLEMPIAKHQGQNLRFVHNGRLVDHKGADLAIKAVAKTKLPIHMTVIGRGVERPKLIQLAKDLKIEDRVEFIEWIEDHDQVAQTLQQFRAFVFPSLAEANGIVVQEAMMLGIPVIALDWGGPALLVTPECGYLVKADSEEQVTTDIAKAMDELAANGELATRMGTAGRERAVREGYLWSDLIGHWIGIYQKMARSPAVAEAS